MSPAPCARSAKLVAIAVLGCLIRVSAAQAQAQWDARLDIAGYPSPYLSDWESNPSIATLTITNPTGADQSVLLVYRVTDQQGRQLATGRSDPQLIPRGAPTVITDVVNVSGSSQHDQALEDQMRRTGRLPEGDNTACVAVTDPGGFVLAEDCATFSVVYPDPPYLIGPLDDASLASGQPVFQWTPLQVPPAFRLTYVVRLSEVLAGQSPLQALVANIPVFSTTAFGTNLEYPLDAAPLVEGKTYAWSVQALDQNGYAASSNEGRSEVWTFQLGEPAGGGPVGREEGMDLEVVNIRGGAAAPAPDSSGFLSICQNWSATDPTSPHSTVRLGLSSPIGFPSRLALRAQVHRYNVPGTSSRVWALVGTTNRNRIMAYGDCDGRAGAVPWPQWLGIRSLDGSASVEWLMKGDTSHMTAGDRDSTPGLEFGIVLFSLRELSVVAPPGFLVVQEFLEGRSIDIKPGINAYGILQLKERAAWAFFEWLGYDEKEITLQGFVGLNNAWSVGLGASSDAAPAGDVSLVSEWLNLRAALPQRRPPLFFGNFAESMHIEFEFKIQDSLSMSQNVRPDTLNQPVRNSALQHDFIFNIIHIIDLNESAIQALGLEPGAQLVGTVGLDIGRKFLTGQSEAWERKLVVKYELDGMWSLGHGWEIGHPQVELDVTLNTQKAGTWLVAITGAIGRGGEELGVLGFSFGRESKTDSITPADVADRVHHEQAVARSRLRLDGLLAQQRSGRATEAQVQQERDVLAITMRNQARWQETYEANRRLRAGMSGDTTATGAPRNPESHTAREWTWAIRASIGNLSLPDLVQLLSGRAR